jgi:hypothetical protein
MTNFLIAAVSWIMLHWRITLSACALAVAASFKCCFERDEARVQRLQSNEKKRLRALADKIVTYGRNVHQRYPSRDVIVSQRDLAEQLRKKPGAVVTALKLLAEERKVQRTSLA